MKRKVSLKNFTPIMAIAIVGVLALVVTASAVGYDKIFNITNYYEAQSNQTSDNTLGAMLAENYDSFIMYNGGFNTAKPMTLQDTLTVSGATTFASSIGITGTTTLSGNLLASRTFTGGAVYSSSTSKAFTLAASTICDNNKVSISFVTSSADSVAITMPATSTVSSYCLKSTGQVLNLAFINSSSFASTTVLTANTDYNFYYTATSTTINGSKLDTISCRRGATAYDCVFNQYPAR